MGNFGENFHIKFKELDIVVIWITNHKKNWKILANNTKQREKNSIPIFKCFERKKQWKWIDRLTRIDKQTIDDIYSEGENPELRNIIIENQEYEKKKVGNWILLSSGRRIQIVWLSNFFVFSSLKYTFFLFRKFSGKAIYSCCCCWFFLFPFVIEIQDQITHSIKKKKKKDLPISMWVSEWVGETRESEKTNQKIRLILVFFLRFVQKGLKNLSMMALC